MSLVKAQPDAALADPALVAVAGLLGLRSGDAVPDFPITTLFRRGALALADWVRGILVDEASRDDWIAHLAALLHGTPHGDAYRVLARRRGGAHARAARRQRAERQPAAHAQPRHRTGQRRGARRGACRPVPHRPRHGGEAFALPSLGVWAAAAAAAAPILDLINPIVAHADTLRLGFGLDAQRRLNFVLAADTVQPRHT